MPARLRRRPGHPDLAAEEGPFVSFTDLFIGILFLFLILVAALMLMHQEAVQAAEAEERRLNEQIDLRQARLDAIERLDADHPPFRLALVYNSFQRGAGDKDWTFSRTVQIFRAPNGLCLENVILRNNLSLAWKPPVKTEVIPSAGKQDYVRMGTPCVLTAAGEHWNSESETGSLKRISGNLYSGTTILHKKDGDRPLELQYRLLGIYDEYFGQPNAQGDPKTLNPNHT